MKEYFKKRQRYFLNQPLYVIAASAYIEINLLNIYYKCNIYQTFKLIHSLIKTVNKNFENVFFKEISQTCEYITVTSQIYKIFQYDGFRVAQIVLKPILYL